MQLDHLILAVNDVGQSVTFYTEIMGMSHEGQREPFTVIRVTPDLTLQLAPWGTDGGEHLAFAVPKTDFDAIFDRVKAADIEYGDAFHTVGNMQGPGDEVGSRGDGKAVYFFDPSKHLIEIRHYDS